MNIKGKRTEYNVEIDVEFEDIIILLKQKALNREWDNKVNNYFIKGNKVMKSENIYHDDFEYVTISDNEDEVDKFKKVIELEELFK
jgi:hypothetical protein